jgi:hypothetical protein
VRFDGSNVEAEAEAEAEVEAEVEDFRKFKKSLKQTFRVHFELFYAVFTFCRRFFAIFVIFCRFWLIFFLIGDFFERVGVPLFCPNGYGGYLNSDLQHYGLHAYRLPYESPSDFLYESSYDKSVHRAGRQQDGGAWACCYQGFYRKRKREINK